MKFLADTNFYSISTGNILMRKEIFFLLFFCFSFIGTNKQKPLTQTLSII